MQTLLPDAAARQTILDALDTNLVVEAAAGTGKTTSLVGRIMNLLRSGLLSRGERFAAVTFTTKAAAELRSRLETSLDAELGNPNTAARIRERLTRAKAFLPDCHLGTIHSFCARLLRERPVEAGVSPDFREIEPDDDLILRQRAWADFASRLVSGRYPALRRDFELFGLDLDTLGTGFARFADFPDITEWTGLDASSDNVDAAAFSDGVAEFAQSLGRFLPGLTSAECDNDTLLPILQRLHLRRQRGRAFDLESAYDFSSRLLPKPNLVLRQWQENLGVDKETAKEELARYQRFYEDTVLPFRESGLAAVYAAALRSYREAVDVYDRLRRREGVLNFQDLLMATAALLRDYPEVREDLAGRYPRLLIDEVQDTDPVQAEIMLLLASRDCRERDWRRAAPRPGSLFIVGDPKQSIYRFRRADIVVYQELKRRIVETGGREVSLTANFRSQPALLAWVNATYHRDDSGNEAEASADSPQFFPSRASIYSPAYAPLQPGRPAATAGAWSGVFHLETIASSRQEGVSEKDVLENEAARIARFIRHAVDTGLPLPHGTGAKPAAPGDFLIVTRQKAKTPVYAAALRLLGLECRVSGGGTLAESPAIRLLLPYLDALRNPDDGIRLLAVLRGGLLGIGDDDLYRWKKAGGAFSLLSAATDREEDAAPPPAGSTASLATCVATCVATFVAMMRRHCRLFRQEEPCRALAAVVEELGLWEYASMGDHPGDSVGSLASALDMLTAERAALPTLGSLYSRLEWLRDNSEIDPPPARETAGQAVRIMNLHKTKGLEAPVVFLTSTGNRRSHPVRFAVRRADGGVSGALALYGGQHQTTLLARPREWEELAAEEEKFLAAEKTRLNYVAATRAGAALVVSVGKSGTGWKSAYLPDGTPGETAFPPLPEPENAAIPENTGMTAVNGTALAQTAALREAGREALLAATYQDNRVTQDAPDHGGGTDWALSRGEVLHRLLAARLEEDETALHRLARELLADFDLPLDMAHDMVETVTALHHSDLWRRVKKAGRVFHEAPFTQRSEGESGPVLRHGVIDLAFRETDGWVIVDFKSGAAMDAAAHHDQLAAYREAWETLTGEKVTETGIYFLQHNAYVSNTNICRGF